MTRTTDRNKALVRRLYEKGFNEGDASVYDDLYTPDFRHHHKTIHDVSQGGEGERESMLRFREAIPDVRFEITDCLAEDDRVMVHLRVTGHAARDFPPISAGETIGFRAIALFRIQDGRIAEEWFYRDPTS